MFTPFQVFFADFFIFIILLCAAAVVALILGAVWMYRDAQMRRMDATLWVVLLIVATVFGNFIGFIVVLVIYLVVRENNPIGGPMPMGYGPPMAAPAPAACPVCGGPMTWYPQYQRWYCPTCAQYR